MVGASRRRVSGSAEEQVIGNVREDGKLSVLRSFALKKQRTCNFLSWL